MRVGAEVGSGWSQLLEASIAWGPAARYGTALLLTAVALVLRIPLWSVIGDTVPYATFFPAVVVSALLAGTGPGLAAVAASSVAVVTLFLGPSGSFSVGDPRDQAGLAVFVAIALLLVWVGEGHRRGRMHLVGRSRAYREMVQLTGVGMALGDPHSGRLLMVNRTLCELTGYSEKELLERTVQEITHPEDRDRDADRWKAAADGPSGTWTSEKRYVRKDGSAVWVLVTGTVLRRPDGSPDRSFAVVQDMTARREAEERLRVAQELSPIAFTILRAVRDAEGAIEDFVWDYANPEAGRILGHPPEDLLGRRLLGVLPGNREVLFPRYVAVVETGTPHDIEVPYGSEGIEGWFRNRCVRLGDGVAISFEDVTDRKRGEERLRATSERLSLALAAGRMVAWEWTAEGDRLVLSDNAPAVLGLGDGGVPRTSGDADLHVHPEDLPAYREAVYPALRGGREYVAEFRWVRPDDGRTIWIEERGSVLAWREEEPTRMAGIMLDISERRRAEEELARRADELARSNAELERFAYVASHDLQEPLRTISIHLQLLEKKLGPRSGPDEREILGEVVGAARRMSQLIQDLLTYSRVGRSRRSVPVDAGAALGVALRQLAAAIRETGADVRSGPLPVVLGDPGELVQVFQNLIGNALKFAGETPPSVEISAESGHGWAVISVRDRGPGIPERHLERIFHLFQRLHTRDVPGTGVGLAVCKKAVEAHGGRIWATSREGEGSTFHLALRTAPTGVGTAHGEGSRQGVKSA